MQQGVSVPFRAGDSGYHTFRIPAIVATSERTLLAFAEGRRNSPGDAGNIDILLRRSTDGGRTWEPLRLVADNGVDTAGNPSPVVAATGRIVLLSTGNGAAASERDIRLGAVPGPAGRRVFVQHSDDDGLTWSPQAEITAAVKRADWRWYATGPGHALRLQHGPHAGRLLVPANHSVAPPAGSPDHGTEDTCYSGHAFFSDDDGISWRLGFVEESPDIAVNPNESTAAELPDGRVYFNARNQSDGPAHRVDAYSSDGGRTLDRPYHRQDSICTPVVQGSLLQLSTEDTLLYSAPGDPVRRAVMTIRCSHDRGGTWQAGLTLSKLPAAYSDLVELEPGRIGILYETGESGPYERIEFRTIPADFARRS